MEGLPFEYFKQNSNPENKERPKWHYVYTNNEISDHPVVFECEAYDMAEADSEYEKKIGIKPGRGGPISLSIL